jgi:predicted nucleotidyltransferase
MSDTPHLQDIYNILLRRTYRGHTVTYQEHSPRLPLELDNNPDNIYNIYLFGSRLYRCNTSTSDYDFIAIVGGPYFDNSKLFEAENVNVNVLHIDYINYLLRVNTIWIMMLVSPNLPREFVYLDRIKFSKWELDLYRLKATVISDSQHNWSKAKKYCIQKQFRDANICKKNIIHAIRHVLLGLQVCQHGDIIDYECANDIWRELFLLDQQFESFDQEWKFYESQYKKTFDDLLRTFENFYFSEESREEEKIPFEVMISKKLYPISPTLEFIRQKGLNCLKRDFSFNVRDMGELIICTIDKITPRFTCRSPIAREFTSVVLQKTDQSYDIVAALPPVVYQMTDYYPNAVTRVVQQVSNSPIKHYKYHGGFDTLLYYHGDQWRVYFPAITKRRFFRCMTQQHPGYERLTDTSEEQDLLVLTKLFWAAWERHGYTLPIDRSLSYHFDFCPRKCDMNDILLSHTTVRVDHDILVCVNIVSVDSVAGIQEFLHVKKISEQHHWNTMTEIEQVLDETTIHPFARTLDPFVHRGVLSISNDGFTQTESKNPMVDALNQLQYAHVQSAGSNVNNMETVVRSSHGQCDFLFNEKHWCNEDLRPLYEPIKERYERLVARVENDALLVKEPFENGNMKEYSAKCKELGFHSCAVFDLYKKGVSVRDYLMHCNPPTFGRMLKVIEKQ